MYDDTQLRIIDATMTLIIEKGYSGATTKSIAKLAGVNECTIFRRFENKREIVLAAMKMPKWNPGLSKEDFKYEYDLYLDLCSFAEVYMTKVTPQMVKVSIGLRAAELGDVALPSIMEVPMTFKKVLVHYFEEMIAKEKMRECSVETVALQFISMIFGFTFFDASFGENMIRISKSEYIRTSVEAFIKGIGVV